MYRGKNREERYLYKELMPFGGQLERENRWLKIKGMIPWGGIRMRVREIFFIQRAARAGRAAGDRIIFIETYERQE